ncbi:hypothetical protein L1987_36046 [Smallanthus sonchifolius]|uniref:Uncharacterized protein n=1 Tax=Smallanthus sonchifolius TaxID=185202 RepID=A0ACB9HCY8_9ASTR|nr:hypothetical protein L1987_36046 [Smallanthus sonchifolius]
MGKRGGGLLSTTFLLLIIVVIEGADSIDNQLLLTNQATIPYQKRIPNVFNMVANIYQFKQIRTIGRKVTE